MSLNFCHFILNNQLNPFQTWNMYNCWLHISVIVMPYVKGSDQDDKIIDRLLTYMKDMEPKGHQATSGHQTDRT